MCHLRRGRRAGWVWRWVHTPPPRPSYHNIISEIRRVQVRHTWSSLQSRLVHMVNFRVQIIPGFSRFSWCSALTCWQERSWCCSEVNSGFTRPTKHQQVAKSFVPSLLDLLRTECRDISVLGDCWTRFLDARLSVCVFLGSGASHARSRGTAVLSGIWTHFPPPQWTAWRTTLPNRHMIHHPALEQRRSSSQLR